MIKPQGIHFLMLLGLLPSWNFPKTHANGTPDPRHIAPGFVRRGCEQGVRHDRRRSPATRDGCRRWWWWGWGVGGGGVVWSVVWEGWDGLQAWTLAVDVNFHREASASVV